MTARDGEAGSSGTVPPAGLRVVITAGGRGIGLVTARAFLDAGARVHTCDVDERALESLRENHPELGSTVADVSRPEDVDRLFDDAGRTLGGLDVLVNNAGIAGPTAPVEEVDPREWRRTLEVNIDGQFLCVRRAVPLLKSAGGGAIINVSSVAGRLGYALRTPYAASKWAVIGFTRSLARELGPHGIRVNAVLPGLVDGPRLRDVLERRAEAEGVSYQEIEDRYVGNVSLGRMVRQEDVAGTILFLSSPVGASFSGQSLSVCGDLQVI